MKQMICVEPIQYPPGVFIKAGQKFQAFDEDVFVLEIAGKAKIPENKKTDRNTQTEVAED